MAKQKKDKSEYLEIYSFAEGWVKLQFKVFSANDFKKAYLEKHEAPKQVNVF